MNTINQSVTQLFAKVFALFPALALLLTVKGGFVGMSWLRPMKTRKGIVSSVSKQVSCVGRVGINHENRAAVQAARESGELPSTNQGLPWGVWAFFPYFITHNGNLYVRLYPVEGSKPDVVYFANGQPISKGEAILLCLASEFSEVKADIGCMTLNIANLKQVRYSEQVIDVPTEVLTAS